jgi:Rab GDP dissociation inhibitor
MVLQMFERFKPEEKPPAELGASRDYNIDLVPKFIMVRMPWCEFLFIV